MARFVIDLDKPPFVPLGCTLVANAKDGRLEWDPEKISLMELQTVWNSAMLDFLLEHLDLVPIPEDDGFLLFPQTVYRDSKDRELIRVLHCMNGRWRPYCFWPETGDIGGLSAT